jgi:hypothetical protein
MTEEKPKKLRGRPPHQPTEQSRSMVETLAGYGVPQEDIGRILKIGRDCVRTHYLEEFENGRAKANATICKFLYTQAQKNLTAAIFWAKAQMQWKDSQRLELSDPKGQPLAMVINFGKKPDSKE